MPAAQTFVVQHDSVHITVHAYGKGPRIVMFPSLGRGAGDFDDIAQRLAAAGYRVLCPQPRGLGGSTGPLQNITLHDYARDVAAVIDALGDGEAIVFGHDWGAPIAWNTARLHASKVRAVAGLSVPYTPVGPESSLVLWQALYADKFFYQNYFVPEGVAEEELGADCYDSIRKIYYALSGAAAGAFLHVPDLFARGQFVAMWNAVFFDDVAPTIANNRDLAIGCT